MSKPYTISLGLYTIQRVGAITNVFDNGTLLNDDGIVSMPVFDKLLDHTIELEQRLAAYVNLSDTASKLEQRLYEVTTTTVAPCNKPAIKPLDWIPYVDDRDGKPTMYADTIIGRYDIEQRHNGFAVNLYVSEDIKWGIVHPTQDMAKSAASQHYHKMIEGVLS